MKTKDDLSRPAILSAYRMVIDKRLDYMLAFGLILAALLLTTQTVYAASQLMVSPTRVVFEGRTRTAKVTLANIGDQAGTYRISFVQRRMDESGQMIEVKEGESGMFADHMVRFSPRQVDLQPGQSQTIRLLLRKKSGLAEGEYRSHLLMQALPDPQATSIQTLSEKDKDKIQIQLIPVVGVTIPIIVRQGNLRASANLDNLKFEPATDKKQPHRLSLRINRDGNRSIYGDFKVNFIAAKGDKKSTVTVARANGVAVYTPNSKRRFTLKLQPPPGVKLKNGTLHVLYLQHGQDSQTGLIAEGRLPLP